MAIFIECSRADDLDLATGKRRLQNICRVHRALGIARADKVVHFVDEKDDIPLALHLVDQPFNAAFELPAELRARNKRGEIEQVNFFIGKLCGDLPRRDLLRKALGDGGLTDAGLADQARVVFCAAAQDLHCAVDLAVAANDTIQLPASCTLGQIGAIQRQVFALFILLLVFLRIAAFFGFLHHADLGRVDHIAVVVILHGFIHPREQPLHKGKRQRTAGLEALLAVGVFHHLLHLL